MLPSSTLNYGELMKFTAYILGVHLLHSPLKLTGSLEVLVKWAYNMYFTFFLKKQMTAEKMAINTMITIRSTAKAPPAAPPATAAMGIGVSDVVTDGRIVVLLGHSIQVTTCIQ